MHIAYFVNIYPKVSHSFIRREILALEEQGVVVQRYALRSAESELVDTEDRRESRATRYVLRESAGSIARAALAAFLQGPLKFSLTIARALRMGWRSDRGLLLHVAYFLEACVLVKWTRSDGVQHLHAHFGTNSAAVSSLARSLGGPPYSFTVHGPEEFDKPQFLDLAEKVRHARFVVAISSYGRSQLYRWLGVRDWPRVQLVRCALGPDYLNAVPTPVSNPGRFLCVGRLCEQKGQLLLLRAFSRLVQTGAKAELVFAGDGPLRGDLVAEVQRLGLEDRVRFTGWLSGVDVRREIERTRVLVLPSFAEGLPVVIMEALALARPVISTYVAGIPELVEPEISGWLVPAGCIDSLVEAMQEALHTSSEHLTTMGKAGRVRVMERHDLQKESKRLAALFEHGPAEIA